MNIRKDDFLNFIKMVQDFKIKYEIIWELPKPQWQDLITALGYNITSLACMEVRFTNTAQGFVFFKGRGGAYMFMVEHIDGKLIHHVEPHNVFQIGEDE